MLNMRVGGPYKVTVTVGFQTQIYNEVYLELGKPLNLDAILKDESQQLSEVMVTGAKSKVLVVVERVENTIGRKELTALPFQDQQKILRLEPSASGGSLEVEMINTTVTL
jgi:hypothetical protein